MSHPPARHPHLPPRAPHPAIGFVSLVLFFLMGGVLLALVQLRRAITAAGNTPPRLP